MSDQGIERLLDYHGRRYWLTNGWSLRFRIWRVEPCEGRSHGIRYSFTLHDEAGKRILGFDNKHPAGRQWIEHDHWHRFRRTDERVRYAYVDADTLLVDFFKAVEASCKSVGVALDIELEDEDDEAAKAAGNWSEDDDPDTD